MQCLKMIRIVPKRSPKKHPVLRKLSEMYDAKSYMVPCGKCAFCLTNRRSSWMFRIHHEMRTQEYKGHFLTLTYDEKHVKRVGKRLSLRFRDVQLFLKKVRKSGYYAKYVCVGEYGPQTKRPHYHMLLWTDCSTVDLDKLWQYGSIHFGRLSMASAMYTLKYIIQPKQKEEDGIEKTRAQFSKGLGLGYLTKEMYDHLTWDFDEPQLFDVIDGRKVALPRYYRTKIFTRFQLKREASKVYWKSIKDRRAEQRDLIRKGIWTKQYVSNLRADQCREILKTTKFNLTL